MIVSDTISSAAPPSSGSMPWRRTGWQLRASRASIRKLLAFALTVDLLYALVAELEQFKSKSSADTTLEASVTRNDGAVVEGEGQQLRRLAVSLTRSGLMLEGRPVSAAELVARAKAEKAVKVVLRVDPNSPAVRQEDLKVIVPLNAAGLTVDFAFNQK